MALRARTGSLRLEVESLELRIAEIEAEKAAGSLRFRGLRVVWLGFESAEASESEGDVSESDAGSDSVGVDFEGIEMGGASELTSDSGSESARSTGANSSAEGGGVELE